MVSKIVLDTEFTDFGDDGQPISIALVDVENGLSCYVELSDGWKVDQCSEFVVKNVLPNLTGKKMTRAVAKVVINDFLSQFDEYQILSDAPGFDFQMLYAVMGYGCQVKLGAIKNVSFLVLDDEWSYRHNALSDAIQIAERYKLVMSNIYEFGISRKAAGREEGEHDSVSYACR